MIVNKEVDNMLKFNSYYCFNYEDIIKLIQRTMKERKISYRTMGNIVHCDYSSFSLWFNFKRVMSAKMMLELLQELNIEFEINGGTNND